MASTNAKKSAKSTRGTKSQAAKNKASSKRQKTKKPPRQRSPHATQAWGIVLVALGLFLAIAMVTAATGVFGMALSNVLKGLTGLFAYVFPFLVMVVGIRLMLDKRRPISRRLLWVLLGCYAVVCIFHMFTLPAQYDKGYFAAIGAAYEAGKAASGCGVLAELLLWPLGLVIGRVGSYILMFCAVFVCAVLVFDISLPETYKKAKANWQASRAQKPAKQAKPPALKGKHTLGNAPEFVDTLRPEAARSVDTVGFAEHPSPLEQDDDPFKEIPFKEVAPYQPPDLSTNDPEQPRGTVTPVDVPDKLEQMDMHFPASAALPYVTPPLDLLDHAPPVSAAGARAQAQDNAQQLEATLGSFGVTARVVRVTRGPSVTQYEVQPAPGIRVSKVAGLADNIALDLAAPSIRIEAPIPGKSAIGIEVPNKITSMVSLAELLESEDFKNSKSPLSVALGKNIAGQCVVADLSRMPHLLIAGTTGSGKSVCIQNMILSLLYNTTPDQVRMILVDPKVVEFAEYNDIPHLLVPVVTDAKKAADALHWGVREMDERYTHFAQKGARDIAGYNKLLLEEQETPLPFLVVIIDELADLMMVAPKDVEDAICRLAQKGRACGIHLVVATQRPSVNVITGVIKANIPSRIALSLASQVDSRTILDGSGAEKLLGKGDMLFRPIGAAKPLRVQGAFVSDQEVERVTRFIKSHCGQQYDEQAEQEIQAVAQETAQAGGKPGAAKFFAAEESDDKLRQALEIAVDTGQVSVSMLQRRLGIGYSRAGRLVDDMEKLGAISGFNGSKSRDVLMTREEFDRRYGK